MVIGLGAMGAAITQVFLKAGHAAGSADRYERNLEMA